MWGQAITTYISGVIKASDCPPYFIEFLKDLVEMINSSADQDAEKDKELDDFVSGEVSLDLLDVISHAERLLLVLQKWTMAGFQVTVALLEKGGVATIEAQLEEAIRLGQAPSEAFFDIAAWTDVAQDSEYGRLLNIQDLPDSARSFLLNSIGQSEFQIDPDLEGIPDYDLSLFVEGLTYLEPLEITSHLTRLIIKYFSNG